MSNNLKNIDIAIWFFPKGLPQKKINHREKKYSKSLSEKKFKEYAYTRGYARFALGQLFKLNPLEVPIYSKPGNQPHLAKGWGYISLSHCEDALLISWSSKRIGVDIERSDRVIPFKKICDRFFTPKEKQKFSETEKSYQEKFVLENWVMKESAFKCQASKLPSDLFNWEWDRTINICSNYRVNQQFKFNLIQYKNWTIGAATSNLDKKIPPIICTNIN